MPADDDFANTTPMNPWGFVGIGVFLAAAVVFLNTQDDFPEWVTLGLAVVGGVLLTVGCVGAGVAIGVRYADHLRDT